MARTSSGLTDTHTDRHTHRQTDAGNDNTRRPKLASGKNQLENVGCKMAAILSQPQYFRAIIHSIILFSYGWLTSTYLQKVSYSSPVRVRNWILAVNGMIYLFSTFSVLVQYAISCNILRNGQCNIEAELHWCIQISIDLKWFGQQIQKPLHSKQKVVICSIVTSIVQVIYCH